MSSTRLYFLPPLFQFTILLLISSFTLRLAASRQLQQMDSPVSSKIVYETPYIPVWPWQMPTPTAPALGQPGGMLYDPLTPPSVEQPDFQFNMPFFTPPSLEDPESPLDLPSLSPPFLESLDSEFGMPALRPPSLDEPARPLTFPESQVPDMTPNFFPIFPFPGFPTIPSFPSGPTFRSLPLGPSIPSLPSGPSIPSLPTGPSLPSLPSGPSIPSPPTEPIIPAIPKNVPPVFPVSNAKVKMDDAGNQMSP